MAERIPDRDIELLLSEAAGGVAYPATPSLRGQVIASITAEGGGAAAASRGRLRVAYAVAGLVLVGFAIALAVSPSRTAIADFFGLIEGERIEFLPAPVERPQVDEPVAEPSALEEPFVAEETGASGEAVEPPPPAAESEAPALPPPTPIEVIGTVTTLEAVAELAGYVPARPEGQGEPLAIYFIESYLWQAYSVGAEENIVVVLQYERFDLWQKRGHGYFIKGVPFDVRIDTTEVTGSPAYWIESEGHTIRYVDAEGQEVPGSERTVTRNVLVWNDGETFYRLETDLAKEEALMIAESLP